MQHGMTMILFEDNDVPEGTHLWKKMHKSIVRHKQKLGLQVGIEELRLFVQTIKKLDRFNLFDQMVSPHYSRK